jgi:RNA polymerase sigma factor (sigma-70 family)
MVQRNVMPPQWPDVLLEPVFPGSMAAVRGWNNSPARRGPCMTNSRAPVDDAQSRRSARMAAAQAGDASAYADLLRECVPIIAAVARRCGVPADRVDDAVQDVLLTVHRARAAYDPGRPFDAWLKVIAERRSIDLLRRTRRQGGREFFAPQAIENTVDTSADPGRGLEHADAAGQIGRAVAALPARQREAVHQLIFEERSLADAAEATGRSTGSLKVNLHRALKTLRGKLGGGT